MKTINITTDLDIEIRVIHGSKVSELSKEKLVKEIENAIAYRFDRIDLKRMCRGDREMFPSLIRDMYRHELINIARIVLTSGTYIREPKELILRAFDQTFGTFNIPKPLGNPTRCATTLAGIACDSIDAYLAPIRSSYTLDRIGELFGRMETAFCDALECINLDAFFKPQ